MTNIYTPQLRDGDNYRSARLAEEAGSEHLGMSLYELAPGQGMVYHYHVQREELKLEDAGIDTSDLK